jgi:hypothetical protein
MIMLAQSGKGKTSVRFIANANGYIVKTLFETWKYSACERGVKQAVAQFDALRVLYPHS